MANLPSKPLNPYSQYKSQPVLPSRPLLPYAQLPSNQQAPTPMGQAAQQPTMLDKAGNVIQSPLGQAIIGGVGGYMTTKNANDQADKNRGLNKSQIINDFYQTQQADDRARAGGVVNARPLGETQQYVARQKLLGSIMPGLRNFSVTPTDPAVAAAMPKVSGGFRIPEGGFDPKLIEQMYGDATIGNAVGQRDMDIARLDPRAAQTNMSTMLDPAVAQAIQGDVADYQQDELSRQVDTGNQHRQALSMALDEDFSAPQGPEVGPDGKAPEGYEFDKKTGELKKKGSSIWGKIGKAALIGGAGIATAMTGGAASPALMAAIGAGTGAGLGAMSGGGWKGALMGAGLGAATGGLGSGLGGGAGNAVSQGLGAAAKSTLTNPQTIAQIAGQTLPGKAGQIANIAGQVVPGQGGLSDYLRQQVKPKATTPPFVPYKAPVKRGL